MTGVSAGTTSSAMKRPTCSVSPGLGVPRLGRIHQPTVSRYTEQIPTKMMPSGANSKMVKPTPAASRAIESTSRLVEVPIRVHTPAVCEM